MSASKSIGGAVESTPELSARGVEVDPEQVGNLIERNITAVSPQPRIQVRSAWSNFDAAALACASRALGVVG